MWWGWVVFDLKERKKNNRSWINFIFLVVEMLLQINFRLWYKRGICYSLVFKAVFNVAHRWLFEFRTPQLAQSASTCSMTFPFHPSQPLWLNMHLCYTIHLGFLDKSLLTNPQIFPDLVWRSHGAELTSQFLFWLWAWSFRCVEKRLPKQED